MENIKKGRLFKGIFTAIVVAAFCFVLSLCTTGSRDKAAAPTVGAASNFTAEFNLNSKLSKTVGYSASTIYGNYNFLKNNEMALDLDYIVDCSTFSDEQDLQSQIEEWNKTVEAINDSIGIKLLCGLFSGIIADVANSFNRNLKDMSNKEQGDLFADNFLAILGMIFSALYTAGLLYMLISAFASAGLIASIPVIGWIFIGYMVLSTIMTIIHLIIVMVGANNLANGLEAGALVRYNYCVNAYDYVTYYEVAELEEEGFDFNITDAEASFTDYQKVATGEKIEYKEFYYRRAVEHNVTAYTLKISVNEGNGRAVPSGYKDWTEFFFPSYISNSKNQNIKGVKIKSGDRTEALFCESWNESTKTCQSNLGSTYVSNSVNRYKMSVVYDRNTPQYAALHQGVYSFEFDVELIPVGTQTKVFADERSWIPIYISNRDVDKTSFQYGTDGTFEYGTYTYASATEAKDNCASLLSGYMNDTYYKESEYDSNVGVLDESAIPDSDYYDVNYGFIRRVTSGSEFIYCLLPKTVPLKKEFLGDWDGKREVKTESVEYEAIRGKGSLDALAEEAAKKYIDKNYRWASESKKASIKAKLLKKAEKDAHNYEVRNKKNKVVKKIKVYKNIARLIQYVDAYANEDFGTTFHQESTINIIIDETNPYQADIKLSNGSGKALTQAEVGKDSTNSLIDTGYYSSDSVVLNFTQAEAYKKYSNNSGDSISYFDYGESWTKPFGVDGAAPGSGIVEFKYAVFKNTDIELTAAENYSRFLFELNHNANINYRFCTSVAYHTDGSVNRCNSYSYGLVTAFGSVTYGDTQDWLSIYANGLSSTDISGANSTFATIAIDESRWKSVSVSYDDAKVPSASSETFTEEGLYYVFVVAVDYAGNVSNAVGTKFIIDKTNPFIDLQTLDENGNSIYDAQKQIETLKDQNGYINDGYIITKTTVQMVSVVISDNGIYSSGVRVGTNRNNYKVCIAYLGTVDDDACLIIYTDGSISGPNVEAEFSSGKTIPGAEINQNTSGDFFDYGFKVYRGDANYIISYVITDGEGDLNTGGAPSGVFRLSVYASDEVGNVNELKMLFISNVEAWQIEPEAETQIKFDFSNPDNPISNLSVKLHFPIYYINKADDFALDLGELIVAKYMLVNSSDRIKFYSNWEKYVAICTKNPNDIRCGRKNDELKDRFINIEPSSNIVDMLQDDMLYENYYLFQHFQIQISYEENSSFYYVLIQEFEFSTDDLISQLTFVKDEHDKEIGNNLLDSSLQLLSSSNSEMRLKYVDYSTFIRDSDTLSNYNYVDKFTMTFDLMQLAIDNPAASARKITIENNLKFKLDPNGNLNTNQSAGDFRWVPWINGASSKDKNWIYNFTQNSVDIDENGNLVYYFYINFVEYSEDYDIGVTFAVNNIEMYVTKNNAFLGSTPDYSEVKSTYFATYNADGSYTLGSNVVQLNGKVGILVKAQPENASGILFDLNLKSWDSVKAYKQLTYYYCDSGVPSNKYTQYCSNNGTPTEIALKKVKEEKNKAKDVIGIKYVANGQDNDVFILIPLYMYFEELHLAMDRDELNTKYRFTEDPNIVLEYLSTDEKGNPVYLSAGAAAVVKDPSTNKYIFSSNVPAINGKDVYIGFYNSYIEVFSIDIFEILLDASVELTTADGQEHLYINEATKTFNNFHVDTKGGKAVYGLTNSYTLLDVDGYLSIYSNNEYKETVNNPDYIPSTGKFNFAEAMGVTPSIYTEDRDFYSEVYWTNSTSLSFEITNYDYYNYAYIFGPSLKYQYGVIPTSEIDLTNVIALYAHYNSIDLIEWFSCVKTDDLQCLASMETIKNSILSEYYAVVSDGFKNKIDTYLTLNGVAISTLNREKLIEIGAYSLDYQYYVAKAFVGSTKTLFSMFADETMIEAINSKQLTLEKAKEQFLLDKFREEINARNEVENVLGANKDYYYKNYYFDATSGDYKYMVASTLTMQDLYASALSLYMSNISTTSWTEAKYCYESTTLKPCKANSTDIIDATSLLGETVNNEYVVVYRVIDSLGRTSLNFKVVHFFSDTPITPTPTVSEIVLTDTNTFYSVNTGEATLNLTNLQNYMFGSESFEGYIARWFAKDDTFYANVVDSKLCIVGANAECAEITNDQVIAMQIGETYTFKFTLTDKAGNVLEFTAPFQLIYNVAPTFDISIENPNVYETNKDINVVVQYRSVAGLDYDRSLTSITLSDGNIVDAAKGVFYLDLSDYGYSATAGVNKNGAIVVGKKVIDIYSDINGKEYSKEFVAFLDGISFKNNLLVDENGYYLNVAQENRTFIIAADMTKPIRANVNEVGRTRVYSSIISVPNIDITAPQVAFDNQFKDQRDMVDNTFYFSTQSVILYFKDFNGVGISTSNISYVSVKPVYDSEVCAHGDIECIAAALETMSSVPALSQNIENGYIWVDVTPNLSRMGLTTYYVSVKDDLNNVAYFRYDIQLDTVAPSVDVTETYINELDENGFSKQSNISITFNSSKSTTSDDKSYEVSSPLDKIIIREKEINSSEAPIETVIMCNGKCDTTMNIPYTVRKEKVNLTLSLYDVAGNKSTDFVMTVTIDNLVPDLTIEVRSDLTTISNKPVNVLVVATDNFSFFDGTFEENGILHYDIEVMKDNSGVWERINNNYEYVIKENGTYRFRANDMAKNFVEHEIVITNIDNKAPTLTFTPDGGPEAQSHTINMKIEEDLSYLSVINYCWVTTNSNITECNETVPGYVSNKISSNQTIKEITVTQNTGENANPDGEYVMVVYVSDEWGNGKTYISKPYVLNSKKPSITPNQSLVSDSSIAIIDEALTKEVGHTVYVSELTITDSNNIAHLFSDKARVTITGESTKELVGQWVSGFGGTPLATPITFDNIFVTDGANGDYYYLKFSTTYEDSNKEIQTAIVYLVVHVIDRSIPEITLIRGPETIKVNKDGEGYELPGVSITDINEGTLYENSTLRSVYFFPLGTYVPTKEELEADMVLTTHQYIKYESNTTISTKTVGTFLVYYVVTDSSGNFASAIRRIDVIDDIAPVITLDKPLTIENFIYVKEEDKRFNVYDFVEVSDNYDNVTAENVVLTYEYRTEAGTFVQYYYEEGKLQTLGYHKFTYTLIDTSGNMTTVVRIIHTVNVEIKYLNGEQAGTDVSLNENDSFIIKGGVRIKANNLRVLVNEKPIEEVSTQVNVSGEVYYEYSANGRQDIKVIDDIGNEVVYSLYMIKIDELNPEEQEELKVLIDKTLITSSKQIVASSSDFVANLNDKGEAVSYTIFLNNYNINIDGKDAITEIDGEKVANSIIFALFCDNVLDNNGVKCSTNYLELTLEGKTLNTSSTIPLTESLNAITISVAEYNNMIANGNRLVMLVVTEDQAQKVETYVPPVETTTKISSSTMSTAVLFGVPSVIGLVAVLRVLKFKKSVKTV